MPKPPKETGREAFNQAQSGRGTPARSTRDSRMVSSNTTMVPSNVNVCNVNVSVSDVCETVLCMCVYLHPVPVCRITFIPVGLNWIPFSAKFVFSLANYFLCLPIAD